MSFDPAQLPKPSPDAKSRNFRRLILPVRHLGARAAAFLLAQAPRLAIALLLRSLGAAFDQQVLLWVALGAGALGGLW
ncbi:MAG: hypothetical protein ACU0A8_15085 [Limimaricola soesokkakensis]|uniref:hypothetical protein n=1 Tax=Limimaricola soesokkakensis TaxID=1343159 RepID=UPI00405925FF